MSVFGSKKTEIPPLQPDRVPTVTPSSPSSSVSHQLTVISGGSLNIKGNINSEEDTTIDSRVEGNVHVKKKLIVGRNAFLQSEIDAFNVVIQGKVEGNVHARNMIEIVAGGSLHGNIRSPKILIADGAFFEGNVDMKSRENSSTPPFQSPSVKKVESSQDNETKEHQSQSNKPSKK